MDKTDNLFYQENIVIISVLLYFTIQPFKSEPDKLTIISQSFAKTLSYCHGNTFPI